uniref:Transposase, MuDR, MULE transposase domain protein n=1 Tax=Tanacetum cinerariifolium TaxID=118510 RepID=A0A6L2J150_TANCI|nr:transposase, MuDR, MULE transposase domain protein [Tanacetum cinerariifolium]
MFFIYELVRMLGELGLGDNNKIMYTYFRIPSMSLDDGLVSLMADEDVIKLLNYVPMYKEIKVYIETNVSSKCVGDDVVIKEIVEYNVFSTGRKESRNDENIGNLDCDNEVPTANVFSFRNLMEYFDVEIHNVANEHENVDGVHEQTAAEIREKVVETLMGNDLFQQDSFVKWQQDPYHFVNEQQEIAQVAVELNHSDEEVCF